MCHIAGCTIYNTKSNLIGSANIPAGLHTSTSLSEDSMDRHHCHGSLTVTTVETTNPATQQP